MPVDRNFGILRTLAPSDWLGEAANTMCDMLVLDDDPLVRTMLVEALREEGLDVIGAGDETEALAALRLPEPPRVFVTDLDLGTKRNGFVIAGMAQMLYPGVAIIYITGRPDSIRGHVMGEREMLLMKPFRPGELVAAARQMMSAGPSQPA